jgi:hypothetical protein
MDKGAVVVNIATSSDGAAAVDPNYYWQPIATCPRSVKVQLLGKGGVAVYASYHSDKFFTHWAPLPKRRPDDI